jgi:hypothetical protein
MEPRVEPLMEQDHLPLVHVSMVGPILIEMVKPFAVLIDVAGALL